MSSCSDQHMKVDNFRSSEKYCDVKVRVQDQNFSCHRVVLASASEYFDALFGGSFKEKDAQETTLKDIDAETFEEVLRCVYNLHEYKCKSTVSNVYKLLSASLFLKIHLLESKCVSYMIENVSSIQNHVQIFALARSMEITVLIDVVSKYLIENLELFYDDVKLLELSIEDLSFLLNRWSRAELLFKYESLMFHLLIRWILHAPVIRRKYFVELMKAVDFEQISPDYVTFMLGNLEDFATPSDPEKKQLLGKRKLKSDLPLKSVKNKNDEGLRNRLLLQRKISEYFLGNEKLSVDCDTGIPASFHDSGFYKNVLGLHIFAEYSIEGETEREYNAQILSFNKYYPEWLVSGETNAWNNCKYRWIGSPESTNFLYSMEIFGDRKIFENCTQRFCTYSSIDMKQVSKVLAAPPITLENKKIKMCAVPGGNIYLKDSQMSTGSFQPMANGVFSVEQLKAGFYCYNCEVDKWFPAPAMKKKQFYPCLTADGYVIYSVGTQPAYFAEVLDLRSGKWMSLPNCEIDVISKYRYPLRHICTLKGKVFISDGVYIGSFDTVANKWEEMNSPVQDLESSIEKMLSYNDNLLLLVDYSYIAMEAAYEIATYRSHSQDWHLSESFTHTVSKALPDMHNYYEPSFVIKDIITFKM